MRGAGLAPPPVDNGGCANAESGFSLTAMKRGLVPAGLPMLALAGLFLASCATAPARLVRSPAAFLEKRALATLLEDALVTPNEGDSATALGRFVEAWRKEQGEAVTGVIGTIEVRFSPSGPGRYAPGYFDELSAAEDFKVKGMIRYRREGIGAPLVGVRENLLREPIERHYPPEAITRPVTAVLHDEGLRAGRRQVRVELLCAHRHDSVRVAGRSLPLAADPSAALAALLGRTSMLKRGEFQHLLTDMPERKPKLYLMEPYDPCKEPLLMIHGLLDSPLKWAMLTNELFADPEIVRRYQVWHFLYNTSAPALYPGRLLRTQYREMRRELDPGLDDPASRHSTLVTHSMGGLVARGLITDPGRAFEKAAFTRPIASLDLSATDRAMLEDAFFWKPEPSVRRVIFIAVPHRGSEFADNAFGRFGQRLFKPPGEFRAFYERISVANPGAFTPAYEALGTGELDSVGALSPRHPTLRILPDLPVLPGLRMHSIIGNRGKAGPLEESSDGVVAYWSSHLDGVESETIVPVDHSAVDHPGTVAEVKRILSLP